MDIFDHVRRIQTDVSSNLNLRLCIREEIIKVYAFLESTLCGYDDDHLFEKSQR